jgi:hypothetical protein
MKARLLVDKTWWIQVPLAGKVIRGPRLPAGTVVPVAPAIRPAEWEWAANGPIRYWIDTPELKDDSYGIPLRDGEFELFEEGPT